MIVYVVTMYRYGNRESHSYVLGVWSSKDAAYKAGQIETAWRGDKYSPEISVWGIDRNEYDDISE